MRLIATLVLSLLLASAAAFADEDASAPKPPSHAQPSQHRIEQLAPAARSQMSVDLSNRDAREVNRLYRELMQETAPARPQSRP